MSAGCWSAGAAGAAAGAAAAAGVVSGVAMGCMSAGGGEEGGGEEAGACTPQTDTVIECHQGHRPATGKCAPHDIGLLDDEVVWLPL